MARCYVGHGLDHVVLCPPCGDAFYGGAAVETLAVCGECLGLVVDAHQDSDWKVRGTPVPFERPEPFGATVTTWVIPRLAADELDLVDVACAEGPGRWYGLCSDGTLLDLSDARDPRVVATGTVRADFDGQWIGPTRPRPRLHVAPSGEFAAVVNDYGRFGRVVDLRDGSVTMRLDGGDGHCTTVPFSLTFAVLGGRPVVVHRTAWNRLDVSDPATGEVLTRRETARVRGAGSPPHHLDYFHGAVHASPDAQWLVDDGWVWHPRGVVVAWSLSRWLSADVWESEDGASLRVLCGRDYSWDVGMCWLDHRRVAVWGIGEDDEVLVDGARVFDVTRGTDGRWCRYGTELGAFAGPAGTLFGDGDRLYSAGPEGLSIWDVPTGERTGRIDGFRPARQSRSRGELVEVRPREVAVWRYRDARTAG